MEPRARRRWEGKKTGPNPTDRGKKGSKRSVLTDGRGVPIGLVVGGANTNDHQLLRQTLESIPVPRPRPTRQRPQGLCLDAGYDYEEVRRVAQDFGLTLHVRPRDYRTRQVVHEPHKKARRWVVERTHSWHNRFRRILVRWEKREDTWLAMLHLACGIAAWFHDVLPK
jgi:putative transposase